MIALISDIHGNYAALAEVLREIDVLCVDEIVCLGDIGGYYCQINECCYELRSRSIFSLLGNHDHYLANDAACSRSRSANDCLDYQRSVLTDENLQWLRSLQPAATRHGINMVHGGWNDNLEEYMDLVAGYFQSIEGTVFASGHTHVPCIWSDSGKLYCNPGSVGQPRDGDRRASYALWDGEEFTLKRLEYDVAAAQDAMAVAGFDAYFYENLSHGTRIGGGVDKYCNLTL